MLFFVRIRAKFLMWKSKTLWKMKVFDMEVENFLPAMGDLL